MTRMSRWLHSPRGLLLLFGTVVALPAATLAYLGLEVLHQDAAVAIQQRAEARQNACDRAVHALQADLTRLSTQLGNPAWIPAAPPSDATYVVISRSDVRVLGTLPAYYPVLRTPASPPAPTGAALDLLEFEARDLHAALRASRAVAASANPAAVVEAKQREARILRKLGQFDEALRVYGDLAAWTDRWIDGEPADFFARRARCRLLAQQSRLAQLQREATDLAALLDAGRWRLNRNDYEYISARLDEWGATRRPGRAQAEALAAAIDWLYREFTAPHSAGRSSPEDAGRMGTSGSRVHATDHTSVTIVWGATSDRMAALVAGPEYVSSRWAEVARTAGRPATVALVAAPSSVPAAGRATDRLARAPAETGLPWTIAATLTSDYDRERLTSRRRMVLGGLPAVLVLVAAGSYLVLRSRRQEIALARLQSDFVAAVSHEFRTPLTALRQFNEMLRDTDGLPPSKLQAYHQAQTRATDRLTRLVESVLDFARMEAGKRLYRLEPLDAGAFVCGIVDEFRHEVQARGFDVRCCVVPGRYDINADAEALGRAIRNLLDNAVKYSGPAREVEVHVVSNATRTVSVAVSDKGIGIPRNEQSRIFIKFVRGAAARSCGIKGTGIGLAMTRHIVQGHSGHVRVESTEGRGSTFTIDLPLLDRRPQSPAPGEGLAREAR